MSDGRPAVYKNRPIVEDATRAGEPDSAGRLRLRRDVNPAAIGVSLAQTAETPRRLPAVANVSAPVLMGVALAEIAGIPSQVPSGAHQGFDRSSNDGKPSEAVVSSTAGARPSHAAWCAGS